jgi:hypothetical protein
MGCRPGEGSFCSFKTKYDRRRAPRVKLVVSAGRLYGERPQNIKMSWLWFLLRMLVYLGN